MEVAPGTSILEAAALVNVKIPTLCHHDDLQVAGNCRVCLVEIEGRDVLEAACATPLSQGMVIHTLSPKVRRARRDIVSLLVSEHKTQCTTCFRSMNCELQSLSAEYNVDNVTYQSLLDESEPVDNSSWSIEKDSSKCIRCQRCIRSCSDIQHVNALDVFGRGSNMKISTFMNLPMNEIVCTNCGQCVVHCPTGALTERRYNNEVWDALGDPEKFVAINTAPSVRAGLGEMFGLAPGTPVTGKMVAALRKMGFDAVLDTDFAADLTIMEEGSELLQRLTMKFRDGKDIPIPMLTSCSPGWVKFIEHMYADLLGHLSTAKSPQQMFGAVLKTYYAQKKGLNPQDIVCVAGMPCAAKKYEANRPEMKASGFQDVDMGLTTRELGYMIKQAGIDFNSLPDEDFDPVMGESSGAGAIFGTTGGVMEAALRTVYEIITDREIPFSNLDIQPVRGMQEIKEASLLLENCKPEYSFLEGLELKIAVVHGLTNARDIMNQVAAGESPYHFIEIMACPGGCIGGGGAPIPTTKEIREQRALALYKEDAGKPVRKSHENPEIKQIYDEFLKEPLSDISHRLLHTHYQKRRRY
ncbi:MAG: [FeFe] hydrogenase, group A [Leptospiraceae bacterium]|nr:[FeFe] hydrogenase, group A [Leptospiraceae bacterium]